MTWRRIINWLLGTTSGCISTSEKQRFHPPFFFLASCFSSFWTTAVYSRCQTASSRKSGYYASFTFLLISIFAPSAIHLDLTQSLTSQKDVVLRRHCVCLSKLECKQMWKQGCLNSRSKKPIAQMSQALCCIVCLPCHAASPLLSNEPAVKLTACDNVPNWKKITHLHQAVL